MPGHLIEDVENLSLSDPVVEAHHRIANNLAIIAGLIRSELLTLSTDARPNIDYIERLLQQMSVRIDSLGRFHRLLMAPSHAGTVELGAYLREIVDAAGRLLTNTEHTKILCRFENETTVPAKQAAAIGLLVGEALVNA
jgi:two-component sensor histidine kinase